MQGLDPLSLSELKQYRNRVIGNRGAKNRLGSDVKKVALIVRSLDSSQPVEARIEAAHVIASLSYGGIDSLRSLLVTHAVRALIGAIPTSSAYDIFDHKLLLALARALRAVASPIADVVGPSLWGLAEERPETDELKLHSRAALGELFSLDCLDKLIPLLSIPEKASAAHQHVSTEIASLLGTVIRSSHYRHVILDWLPPDQRTVRSSGRPIIRRTSASWASAASPRSPSAGGSWARGPPQSTTAPGTPGSPTGTKTRRGWEKTRAPSFSGSTSLPTNDDAGWVVSKLVGHITESVQDQKLVEASLYALAALVKDSPDVATTLHHEHSSMIGYSDVPHRPIDHTPGSSALLTILDRAADVKSRHVQVAATLAATHLLRSLPPPHHPHSERDLPPQPSQPEKIVMNILSTLISPQPDDDVTEHPLRHSADSNFGDEMRIRERACFTLYYLTTDSQPLILLAHERGIVRTLVRVIRAITPLPPQPEGGGQPSEPEDSEIEDEPLSITLLREAALTALAALCIGSTEVRRIAVEDTPGSSSGPSSSYIPTMSPPPPPNTSHNTIGIMLHITRSLKHPSVGVRYAAMQCVRALSRSVAVMRTGVGDSGVAEVCLGIVRKEVQALRKRKGMSLIDALNKEEEMEREDRRVVNAALMAISNLVNEFSPMKLIYLSQGLVPLLSVFVADDNPEIDPSWRLSALWIYKNLLVRSTVSQVSDIMQAIGRNRLQMFLSEDAPLSIREQALGILKNAASEGPGIDLLFKEMGVNKVVGYICEGLEGDDEDIASQAAALLGNLSNGTDTTSASVLLTTTPTPTASGYPSTSTLSTTPCAPILDAIRTALTEHTNPDIRRPLMSALRSIALLGHRERREVLDAGIGGTLKRISEWGGKVPGIPSAGARGGGFQDDKEVVDLARIALNLLEHGGEM